MKRNIFAVAAIAMALSSCTNYEEQAAALKFSLDSLQSECNERDSNMKLLNEAIAEISTNIDGIKERKGIISVSLSEGGKKAQIQSDLAAIEQAMEENKAKIQSLRSQLSKSKRGAAQLQAVIDNLQSQVDSQAAEIEALRNTIKEKDIEIGNLHKTVAKVTNSLDSLAGVKKQVEEDLSGKIEELHTGYYIVSDKSTLKSKGFITSGLFKGIKATGKVDKKLFTRVDISTTNTIDLKTRKAQIVTAHPTGSYDLQADGSGNYTLIINDKESFWSMSKSLIVIGK